MNRASETGKTISKCLMFVSLQSQKRRHVGQEKMLEKIMTENFQNVTKDRNLQN